MSAPHYPPPRSHPPRSIPRESWRPHEESLSRARRVAPGGGFDFRRPKRASQNRAVASTRRSPPRVGCGRVGCAQTFFFRAARRSKNPEGHAFTGKWLSPFHPLRRPDADRLPSRAGREGCSVGTKDGRCDAHAAIRRSSDPPREPFAPRRALETTEIGGFPRSKRAPTPFEIFQTVFLTNEQRRDPKKVGTFVRIPKPLRWHQISTADKREERSVR